MNGVIIFSNNIISYSDILILKINFCSDLNFYFVQPFSSTNLHKNISWECVSFNYKLFGQKIYL